MNQIFGDLRDVVDSERGRPADPRTMGERHETLLARIEQVLT